DSEHPFALRQTARTTAQHLRLYLPARRDSNECAESVAIRACAFEAKPQAMVRSAIVAQKNRRSTVGGHHDIEVTVIVEISVRGASANPRLLHGRPNRLR